MASDRALLVDVLPTQDQPLGNAWAAGMFGIGSVLGFFLGSSQLPTVFPFLGSKQLEVFAALSAIIFLSVHLLVSFSVKEQRLLNPTHEKTTFFGIFKDIWVNIRTLPPVIFQICLIQFFAWVAWFPFLFYMTIYISEIYTQQFNGNPTIAQENEGTRIGNRAMLFHAICSLATSIIAPVFVKERGKRKVWGFIDLSMLWSFSLLILTCCLLSTYFANSVTAATIIAVIIGVAWAITQWAPFALLGEAILSSVPPIDSRASIESIPFIDRRSNRIPLHRMDGGGEEQQQFLIGGDEDEQHDDADSMEGPDNDDDDDGRVVPPSRRSNGVMSNHAARRSVTSIKDLGLPSQDRDDDDDDDGVGFAVDSPRPPHVPMDNIAAKAGVILGIHNVFLVIPQFLASALSAIVFKIYEPSRPVFSGPKPGPAQGHTPIPANSTTTMIMSREAELDDSSPDALGVVFRLGGLSAFVAFILAWRLSRMIAKSRR